MGRTRDMFATSGRIGCRYFERLQVMLRRKTCSLRRLGEGLSVTTQFGPDFWLLLADRTRGLGNRCSIH
jgi:hypothetical protein